MISADDLGFRLKPLAFVEEDSYCTVEDAAFVEYDFGD